MKIKTITCHDVYNVGASLQAYALAEYLRQQGHDVEIINYKPYYLRHYELTGVRNPRFDKPILRELYQLAKFPGRLRAQFDLRKKAFDLFTKEYLPVTSEKYANNEELKVNPPDADIYIAGSDQIWNPLFENGKDPAFFLDFVPEGKKRVSYAASFAVDSLTKDVLIRMKERLSSFDSISVREKSAVSLVDMMGLSAEQVCDPVFLIDKDQWEQLLTRKTSRPYLFVYDFDNNKAIQTVAKKLGDNLEVKIVSAFPMEGADEIATNMGPIEFLNLIHDADLVISNSFHATAFSLIFHTPFFVFNRKDSINTRMRDLLIDMRIGGRLISEYPVIQTELDWNLIQSKVDSLRKESIEYLNSQCQ